VAKTRFHALLEERINKAVDDECKSLADGTAQDYAQYRFGVGHIHGLRDALSLCEQIEKDNE